jgi:uncharacterized protein (DUF1330 family)
VRMTEWHLAVVTSITDLDGGLTMTAYLINHLRIPNGVPSSEALTYLEEVEATFTPYNGKWLVLDAEVEVQEGAWPGSVVLMEFPDMEIAKQWYNSSEYQNIVHLRTDNTISDLILVEPVSADFTSAEWARQIRTAITGSSSESTV